MHPINGEIVLAWYKPTAEYFIATFCQCGKQHTVVWKKAGTGIAHVRYERTQTTVVSRMGSGAGPLPGHILPAG